MAEGRRSFFNGMALRWLYKEVVFMGFFDRDVRDSFDRMFDYNRDGKLDPSEQTLQMMFWDDMTRPNEYAEDIDDDDFDEDDFDDFDDEEDDDF